MTRTNFTVSMNNVDSAYVLFALQKMLSFTK